jgi:hypothetical protein
MAGKNRNQKMVGGKVARYHSLFFEGGKAPWMRRMVSDAGSLREMKLRTGLSPMKYAFEINVRFDGNWGLLAIWGHFLRIFICIFNCTKYIVLRYGWLSFTVRVKVDVNFALLMVWNTC